jgi:creatinine amidohydrolase
MAAMNHLPTTPQRFWADLTTAQFDGRRRCGLAARTVAVLPLAAIEQHGPHLPLNVDTTLVDGMVQATLPHLAAEAPVLFLPTQSVCLSNEHAAFAGTLTLRADTVLRVWMELGECVHRAGVNRLVLFNSHGGNVSLMDVVARDLRSRLGMMVWHASWFNLPLGEEVTGLFPPEEHRFGIHGGDIETSLMLALKPEQVDMGQARHFHSQSSVPGKVHQREQRRPLSRRRCEPPSSGRSTMAAPSVTVAPSFSSSFLPGHHGAAGGDQVVDQQHAVAGFDGIGVQLHGGAAVFEFVGFFHGGERQLALFADGHKPHAQLVGHHRAQDEAARVQPGHHVGAQRRSM